jgi:catechol-2,3-dioxygenase
MSLSPKPIAPNPRPIDAGVSIGHVHLKVADLNRAIAFYCGVLDLMQRYGHDYPTRAALADALRRLIHGISIEGASDHGVSEALYLRDPEKNGRLGIVPTLNGPSPRMVIWKWRPARSIHESYRVS